MNLTRSYLNFRALSVSTQWQLSKAKKEYVKKHNTCAICGHTENLEVHHIIPVHIDTSKALDHSNFITLCDWRNHGCHYVFGHFRNFRTKWNPKIREFAKIVSDVLNENKSISYLQISAITAWNTSRKWKD